MPATADAVKPSSAQTMGNLQSSTGTASSRGGGGNGSTAAAKSRNKKPLAAGTRDWLIGGASRALRKPVAPAAASDVVVETKAAAAAVDHVTVTSRDLRRLHTPPARVDNRDTDHHADEQQQQHRQECGRRHHHHHHHHRRHQDRSNRDDDESRRCSSSSSSEEDDTSSVFADTLTSPQSVYSDARDEPYDDDMVVNGGEMLGGNAGGGRATTARHRAFTIVKHRKVELNPTKIQQSTVANGKSNFPHTYFIAVFLN